MLVNSGGGDFGPDGTAVIDDANGVGGAIPIGIHFVDGAIPPRIRPGVSADLPAGPGTIGPGAGLLLTRFCAAIDIPTGTGGVPFGGGGIAVGLPE